MSNENGMRVVFFPVKNDEEVKLAAGGAKLAGWGLQCYRGSIAPTVHRVPGIHLLIGSFLTRPSRALVELFQYFISNLRYSGALVESRRFSSPPQCRARRITSHPDLMTLGLEARGPARKALNGDAWCMVLLVRFPFTKK